MNNIQLKRCHPQFQPYERQPACAFDWRSLTLAMLACMLLAACGSLPRLNPDLALRAPQSIRLEGARGPLSHEQSQTILAGLQRNSENSSIFERHLAVEQQIGGSPLVVGNRVELLIDGPPTYDAMFAAIEDATDHINLETFILEQDAIGQAFVNALLLKQVFGVQVNLIYDSVGSLYTPKTFFQPLIDAGAHVLEYNPINPLKARRGWQLNERDHRKLLVVDGKIAFVGGINISSVYSSGSSGSSVISGISNKQKPVPFMAGKKGLAWRDTHLRVEGPVVGEFQKLFLSTWERQTGKTLDDRQYYPQLTAVGPEIVRAIGTSPSDAESIMYITLLSAINSAESQVYLTNAYFIPDPQLLSALKDAAARGVDVRLLLPSQTDSELVLNASRSFYEELLSAEVKIFERQDALLHAKTAMIDGVWSTVGSTNLDWRSFLNNQEIDAVMLGQDFGGRMQAMFAQDLQASRQITLADWKKRPLLSRIKQNAARVWARLL